MSRAHFSVVLYSTSGCHLCDLALDVLSSCQSRFQQIGQDISIQQVDIADDEALVERYGVLIPVIRLEQTDQELKWPFDERALIGFLNNSLTDS